MCGGNAHEPLNKHNPTLVSKDILPHTCTYIMHGRASWSKERERERKRREGGRAKGYHLVRPFPPTLSKTNVVGLDWRGRQNVVLFFSLLLFLFVSCTIFMRRVLIQIRWCLRGERRKGGKGIYYFQTITTPSISSVKVSCGECVRVCICVCVDWIFLIFFGWWWVSVASRQGAGELGGCSVLVPVSIYVPYMAWDNT